MREDWDLPCLYSGAPSGQKPSWPSGLTISARRVQTWVVL